MALPNSDMGYEVALARGQDVGFWKWGAYHGGSVMGWLGEHREYECLQLGLIPRSMPTFSSFVVQIIISREQQKA